MIFLLQTNVIDNMRPIDGHLARHGELGRAAIAAEGAFREELNHLVIEVAVHRAREADAGLAAE